MAQDRPDIPMSLRRAALVEAGHRCAIPTCRQTPVELAHITPWVKVRKHAFENLIALCPTCHTRFDRGDIDRRSMLQYKVNLEVMNSRYTDFEQQLLRTFVRQHLRLKRAVADGNVQEVFANPGWDNGLTHPRMNMDMWWAIGNLLDDEIVELLVPAPEGGGLDLMKLDEKLNSKIVLLTKKGSEIVERWAEGEPI
ncbi:HNH endonuclease [Streptomyces alboflavus]|uniref:HNH endonuclease n=1 Tax=Streptomyces alboflavus TaxID=67267 RepID=UPI00367BA133